MGWQVGQPWTSGMGIDLTGCVDQLAVVGTVRSNTQLTSGTHLSYGGGLCYVAARVAARLTVVDVSNPTNPTIVGSITHAHLYNIRAVYYDAADEACYCIASDLFNNNYLTVVDVSNPASMSVIGELQQVSSDPDGFLFEGGNPIREGDLLYIPITTGLTIVDVSDPTDPNLVGTVHISESIAELGLVAIKIEDLVYVDTGTSSIIVFDVSTPSAPTYESGLSFFSPGSFSSAQGMVYDAVEELFYVTSSSKFTIIDMAVPAIVGQVVDSVLSNGTGAGKVGDVAYATANQVLVSIDVSDPTTPTITSVLTDPTRLGGAAYFIINGDEFYIACLGNRLTVVKEDCVPELLVYEGFLTHTNTPYNSLVADGDLIYGIRGSQDRVGVVDASTPASPTLIGNVTDAQLDGATWITKQGSLVWIAAFNADRLTAYDVSNPASPTNAGSITHATNLDAARYVAVEGGVGYVSVDATNRFTTVNISNPASMSILGSITDASLLSGGPVIKPPGNYAYMASNSNAAVVSIDVSNPASPSIADSITTSTVANARDLVKVGNTLFVSTTTRLVSIDVTDPTNISIIDSILVTNGAELEYSPGTGYVVMSATGAIHVISIANPADMFIVFSISDPTTFGTSQALAMSGRRVAMGGFVGATTYIFIFTAAFGGASTGWDL